MAFQDSTTFAVSALYWPRVYEPRAMNSEAPEKFAVSWLDHETPDELRAYGYESRGLRLAQTKVPPEIEEVSEDWPAVARAFEHLDLRNLTRDRMLLGMPAQIVVRPWTLCPEERHPHSRVGNGLTLLKVIIDARHLKLRPIPPRPDA